LAVARALGHEIEPAVPSLFTFNIAKDARLEGLAGVAVERVETSVRGIRAEQFSPEQLAAADAIAREISASKGSGGGGSGGGREDAEH
jgi:predicted flavoprotein YhiN